MTRIARKLAIALALSFVVGVGVAQAAEKDDAIQVLPGDEPIMKFVELDDAVPDTPKVDLEVESAPLGDQRRVEQMPWSLHPWRRFHPERLPHRYLRDY